MGSSALAPGPEELPRFPTATVRVMLVGWGFFGAFSRLAAQSRSKCPPPQNRHGYRGARTTSLFAPRSLIRPVAARVDFSSLKLFFTSVASCVSCCKVSFLLPIKWIRISHRIKFSMLVIIIPLSRSSFSLLNTASFLAMNRETSSFSGFLLNRFTWSLILRVTLSNLFNNCRENSS